MDVSFTLLGNGALGNEGAVVRWVVVAHHHPYMRGQTQQTLDGTIQYLGAAPWEVATRCADVRWKKRVANEHNLIIHQVGNVSGRVARHGERLCPQRTDVEHQIGRAHV